jgi:hypothetical protein
MKGSADSAASLGNPLCSQGASVARDHPGSIPRPARRELPLIRLGPGRLVRGFRPGSRPSHDERRGDRFVEQPGPPDDRQQGRDVAEGGDLLASRRRSALFWKASPKRVTIKVRWASPRQAAPGGPSDSGGQSGSVARAIGRSSRTPDQEGGGQRRHRPVPRDQRLAERQVGPPRRDGRRQQKVAQERLMPPATPRARGCSGRSRARPIRS